MHPVPEHPADVDPFPSTVPPRDLHIVLLDYRDIDHPEAGGAEVYINELFQRIAASGHRVTLISSAYPGASRHDQIGGLRVLRAGSKATANFTTAAVALRLARRERVDVFVENICKIPFFMPALTKIPVLPIVLHLFGKTAFAEANAAVASYVWLYERLIPFFYRGLRFVALSESTALDLKRRGVRASGIEVVPPGLDLRRFEGAQAGEKSPLPLVVYLGRLKRYKQIDIVLRAFALVRRELPEARLAIVGKGDDRERLERVSRALRVADAVSFEGYVSEDEKIDWLKRAHLLVYPSPKEGWGLSTTEAAACGTPVLASDSEGLRDAVKDGVSGFLVPHGDVDAWVRRMLELLRDGSLRARMGEGALAWARQFDWSVAAEKLTAILEQVSEKGRNRQRALA